MTLHKKSLQYICLVLAGLLLVAFKQTPLDPETLVSEAEPLCTAAFDMPLSEGAPELPVLTLFSQEVAEPVWSYAPIFPHQIEAEAAEDVRTLVCIRETLESQEVIWDVRLLQWPDGEVIAADTFAVNDDSLDSAMEPAPEVDNQLIGQLLGLLFPFYEGESLLYTGSDISSVAFSADDGILAVGDSQGGLSIWDIAIRQPMQTFSGPESTIGSLAFSPDGQTLAAGDADNVVTLWDVASGEEIQSLSGHEGLVSGLAFSPDGQVLASSSADETVRLWDVVSGEAAQTLGSHAAGALSVAFSADGQMLASSGNDGLVNLWDVASGAALQTLEGHTAPVASLAFSADGQILASGSADNSVILWDVSSGQALLTLLGHSAPVRSLAFSADGQTLASGSEDATIKLWDVNSGQELLTLNGHANTVTGLAFAPDGQSLISASDDWTVSLWDLASEAAARLPSYIDVIESYPADADLCQAEVQIDSVQPDGQWLVSGSLVFVDNQFTLNCYGIKITVNTALELDGQRYEAGDLLTVDQNLDWIQVASWDGSESTSLVAGDGTLHDLSPEGFTLRLPQEWIALDLEKMDFPELLEDMGEQNERLEGMLSSSVMQNMVAAGFKFYAINTIDESLQADLPINMNILKQDLPFEPSLQMYKTLNISQLEEFIDLESEIEEEQVMLGDHEAAKLSYAATIVDVYGRTVDIFNVQYLIVDGSLAYVITLQLPPELVDEHLSSLVTAVETFRLE